MNENLLKAIKSAIGNIPMGTEKREEAEFNADAIYDRATRPGQLSRKDLNTILGEIDLGLWGQGDERWERLERGGYRSDFLKDLVDKGVIAQIVLDTPFDNYHWKQLPDTPQNPIQGWHYGTIDNPWPPEKPRKEETWWYIHPYEIQKGLHPIQSSPGGGQFEDRSKTYFPERWEWEEKEIAPGVYMGGPVTSNSGTLTPEEVADTSTLYDTDFGDYWYGVLTPEEVASMVESGEVRKQITEPSNIPVFLAMLRALFPGLYR